MDKKDKFSQIVSVFQGLRLPEAEVQLTGYSALINAYDLAVPLPDFLSAASHKHNRYIKDRWMMFTPRHIPENTWHAHLIFALKNEGLDLGVLKALFQSLNEEEVTRVIAEKPTSSYNRRIWFLYEWLMVRELEIADLKKGKYIDLLDSKFQYPGPSRQAKRQKVRNNLPGVPGFCPLVRKTAVIEKMMELDLREEARTSLGKIHPDILIRAAAFMLLKDSKASYAIEGEKPPLTRAERWGKAIGQAGQHELSHDEFLRLQEIVISDFRFTHYGYRCEGGFIGEHERSTGFPIPNHISAKPDDLYDLMEKLIKTNKLLRESDFDPILAATIIAFGFVFMHPFEDGNGRVHRYLIHHVLAKKDFTAQGIVFPVSAVILEHIDDYRHILEAYSKSRLKLIKWAPTDKGNVNVLNNTVDLYSYFDATKQVEFLYRCIQETVEKTLPDEVDYLEKYDAMKEFVVNYLDMPDRLIDLLIRFLIQGKGKFSKRAKQKEFNELTDEEIKTLESKFEEIFGDVD